MLELSANERLFARLRGLHPSRKRGRFGERSPDDAGDGFMKVVQTRGQCTRQEPIRFEPE